jgi:hypothetical protein
MEKAEPIGYSTTVAYIAVPEHLVSTILGKGYKTKTRENIPVSFCPLQAVKSMRRHHGAVTDTVVLEVHALPGDFLDREAGVIRGRELPAQYLRDGIVLERGLDEYALAACPLCQAQIPETASMGRGKVGLWRFVQDAFMICPCPEEACINMQVDRQLRLDQGEIRTLYHQTKLDSAERIRRSGKMIRGHRGVVGAGIYFAESPRETEWKAESKGVVLECEVKLGHQLNVTRADEDPSLAFGYLARQGYDALVMDRGICKVGPHKGKPAGLEFIVYSWDQVKVLREVERDPVQP